MMSTVPDVLVELWFVCDRADDSGDAGRDGPLFGPFPNAVAAGGFAAEYALRYRLRRRTDGVYYSQDCPRGYLDIFLGELAAPEVLAARGGYCSRPTQLAWLGADGAY